MTSRKDPSFFHRLNQTEPFVAIRLIIVQVGIALGLYWMSSPVVPPSEEMNLFPFNLMGMFDVNRIIESGYPLRELIWAGEWWRIPIGMVLPPGFGWLFISIIAFLPLARLVEMHLGRLPSLIFYLTGGLITLLVDFLTSAVIPCGSIGMVFCAAGLVAGGFLLERQNIENAWQKVPPGTWMALILSWGFTWVASLSRQTTPLTIESAFSTEIGPSQEGIIAAFLFGFCFGVPFLYYLARRSESRSGTENLSMDIQHTQTILLPLATPVLFCIGLGSYCLWGWNHYSSVDYQLWRIDPGLREGKEESFQAAFQLMEQNPEDLFLTRRLAVSLAHQDRLAEAGNLLKKISDRIGLDPKDPHLPGDFVSRRYRALCLNRHSPAEVLPWRYSAFSNNFDLDPLRILWGRGHIALMRGATDEANLLRDQLLHYMDQLIPTLEESQDKENQAQARQKQSIVLNHRAYVRTELNGDLAAAIKEASLSVTISPSAENLDTLGWAEIRQGQYQSGTKHLEKALLYNEPRSAGTIHFHLGVGYHRLGHAEKARYHFTQSLLYDLDWWDEKKLKDLCPECLSKIAEQT